MTPTQDKGWLIILTLCLALSLTACGRRGAPLPPGPPTAVTYPHVYPAN